MTVQQRNEEWLDAIPFRRTVNKLYVPVASNFDDRSTLFFDKIFYVVQSSLFEVSPLVCGINSECSLYLVQLESPSSC